MRDDVKTLFDQIVSRLQNKASILKNLLDREPDKQYLLKSGSIPELLHEIESDDAFFDAMDLIDYEISSMKMRVAEISGVQADDFERCCAGEKSESVYRFRSLMREIPESLKELAARRRKLLEEMERMCDETMRDIKTLRQTRRFIRTVEKLSE